MVKVGTRHSHQILLQGTSIWTSKVATYLTFSVKFRVVCCAYFGENGPYDNWTALYSIISLHWISYPDKKCCPMSWYPFACSWAVTEPYSYVMTLDRSNNWTTWHLSLLNDCCRGHIVLMCGGNLPVQPPCNGYPGHRWCCYLGSLTWSLRHGHILEVWLRYYELFSFYVVISHDIINYARIVILARITNAFVLSRIVQYFPHETGLFWASHTWYWNIFSVYSPLHIPCNDKV